MSRRFTRSFRIPAAWRAAPVALVALAGAGLARPAAPASGQGPLPWPPPPLTG